MPFNLRNAPTTFQCCMVSNFSYMVEDIVEVFIIDFLVVGDLFDDFLVYLSNALQRCKECNLILNWEKFHFMVKIVIVLCYKIAMKEIKFDKVKIELIENLPPLISMKVINRFVGHVVFYGRFIKGFSNVENLLCEHFRKEVKFVSDDACLKAFEFLKGKLISASIIMSLNWSMPFDVMYDASGVALGTVQGQWQQKILHPIYYGIKTLNPATKNYITTELELFVVLFSFEKIWTNLLGTKITVHTEHTTLRCFIEKMEVKQCLIYMVLLLQEFDFEVKDLKRNYN